MNILKSFRITFLENLWFQNKWGFYFLHRWQATKFGSFWRQPLVATANEPLGVQCCPSQFSLHSSNLSAKSLWFATQIEQTLKATDSEIQKDLKWFQDISSLNQLEISLIGCLLRPRWPRSSYGSWLRSSWMLVELCSYMHHPAMSISPPWTLPK